MLEQHCVVSANQGTAKELKQRLKKIEAQLRGHDPDEGYEWPEPRERGKAEED